MPILPAFEFQSLAGFLGRCDLLPCQLLQIILAGFNPWRVFLVVATCGWLKISRQCVKFQSLAGFLGRCDSFWKSALKKRCTGFQSLAGFLGRCDIPGTINAKLETEVSIPGGFSWSLRHWSTLYPRGITPSFNPWRVFLVVATTKATLPVCPSVGFNPWRVFLVVAT